MSLARFLLCIVLVMLVIPVVGVVAMKLIWIWCCL